MPGAERRWDGYDVPVIMPPRSRSRDGDAPQPVEPVPTPATDSDLNELLSVLGSQVKMMRRENKQLVSHNTRLAVALAQQGVVTVPDAAPVEPLVTPEGATASDLIEELRSRLAQLDREGGALRRENGKLAELAEKLQLPTWRIEETRVGSSKLVPGPRAFIRRRRMEPRPLPRRGPAPR